MNLFDKSTPNAPGGAERPAAETPNVSPRIREHSSEELLKKLSIKAPVQMHAPAAASPAAPGQEAPAPLLRHRTNRKLPARPLFRRLTGQRSIRMSICPAKSVPD